MIHVFLLRDSTFTLTLSRLSFYVHPHTTWALNLENTQQLYVELILYMEAKTVPLVCVSKICFDSFYFFWQQRYMTQDIAQYFSSSERWRAHAKVILPLDEGLAGRFPFQAPSLR